ncbi:hypothetical protein, partial [Vibrio kanaloae]|uniref:hypothetical protein n=1 Tax=Vibrio kanaloae TaxID=170673 RepID=UPI0019D2729A
LWGHFSMGGFFVSKSGFVLSALKLNQNEIPRPFSRKARKKTIIQLQSPKVFHHIKALNFLAISL